MPVTFRLRVKHPGSSHIESYMGKDGKVVSSKIAGAIEEESFSIAGKLIAQAALETSRRNLFLAAMFFQRVVSRTPMDETYYAGVTKDGQPIIHKADDDYVRDAWTATYNNYKITAKQLREKGIDFIKFNNRNEVKQIYNEFLNFLGKGKGLLDGKAVLKGVRIENTHERFAMLEYGEFEKDGSIKSGEHFKHGVKGGYSVQAPVGMLRLTQQEFEDTAFNIPTKDLMIDGRKWQTSLKKSGSIKTIAKMLKGKSKISFREACEIARAYL